MARRLPVYTNLLAKILTSARQNDDQSLVLTMMLCGGQGRSLKSNRLVDCTS